MSPSAHFEDLSRVSLPPRPVHLAIGMFDGVHLGHRSVIGAAVTAARGSHGLAGVLTFWPHPARVLRPGQPVPLIHDRATKRRVLLALGLDFVVEQEFTPAYAATPAAEFMPWLRRCLPHLAAVYVGENWRYGHGREGDVARLTTEAARLGVAVVSAPRLHRDGTPISSSRIRELVSRGALREANALLGSPYTATGTVQPGRRLGRELGFPTLNLPWEPDLRPAYGVYAVNVTDARGREFPGVANYGVRPTVASTSQPLLEIHVLGPCDLGPDDTLTVEWLEYLRPEQKFAGIEDLRAAIAQDREKARAYFRQQETMDRPPGQS